MPLGVLPALVGGLQSARRHPGQPEVQPAPRHVVGAGDTRRSPGRPRRPASSVRHVVARRPAGGRPLQLRPRRGQLPPPRLGAGTRPAQPGFGFGQRRRSRCRTWRIRCRRAPRVGRSTRCRRPMRRRCRRSRFCHSGNRPDVQIVFAQRGGAHDARVGAAGTRARRRGRRSRSSIARRASRSGVRPPRLRDRRWLLPGRSRGTGRGGSSGRPCAGSRRRPSSTARRLRRRPYRRGSTSRPPGSRGSGGRLRAPRRTRS